jgi:hypothetical protein
MDFEEAALPSFVKDRREVLVLEAGAGEAAGPKRGKARRLGCKPPG